ncbi:carboxyl transferase domain-containing protein [Streptomyces sp. NPDC002133]|uniref:carboxyl transferase domain-containing protein n=1 Tax=Streptomyces sp. NPDC002133 TaxID=3154409 RepID=UPI0033252B51
MSDGLTAREAIALVADRFEEARPGTGAAPASASASASASDDGPIGWAGYGASRARAVARTGEEESVVWGTAEFGGRRAVVVSFEFPYMGGSLGERTGDRLEAAYAHARTARLPLVSLIATGGSRMQEGMVALTQLQRVARAPALLRAAGLPQIAVVRDPTTGGGWATLGAGADVILALPGAQIGFAGSRVRPPDADPSAYTAEGQLAAGQIDAIVRPEELRPTLALWLILLTGGSRPPEPVAGQPSGPGSPAATAGGRAATTAGGPAATTAAGSGEAGRGTPPPDRASPTGDAAGSKTAAEPQAGARPPVGVGAPTSHGPSGAVAAGAEEVHRGGPPVPPPAALGDTTVAPTGWAAVQQARSARRPRAGAYLDAYFDERLAVRGDCRGGTGAGMLCGFGLQGGRSVAYAAQTGTATRPAGYRAAARLIRLADRLGIPVLTLVDTPGAANDAEAERDGAGAAIAEVFAAIAEARVPVTTLVIGEGGSGGALALAAPGRTWATPDSYFSVIAPELAAAILKRAPSDAPATADQLRLRPQDLVELGVVRGIVTSQE